MTLWLGLRKYVDSYSTNWHYLHNMTDLQMISLKKMKWYGDYISTNLWAVPDEWQYRTGAENSAGDFIIDILSEKIKRL